MERTSWLITADGSEDFKIRPKGLTVYQVIPPLETFGSSWRSRIDVSEPTIDPDDNIISDDIETSDDIEQSDFVDLESEDLNEDSLDNEKDW